MKAILIDPNKQVIMDVVIDKKNGLQDYYDHMECDTFAVPHYLENEDALYVDDEGLLKQGQQYFKLDGWIYPVAGPALIVGTNVNTGDSVNAKTKVEDLEGKVEWWTAQDAYIYSKMNNL